MFGRSKKQKAESTLVQMAVDRGFIELASVGEIDEHLKGHDSKSQAVCLVRCGWLTIAQARELVRDLETNSPEDYVLELLRRKRASISLMREGLKNAGLKNAGLKNAGWVSR